MIAVLARLVSLAGWVLLVCLKARKNTPVYPLLVISGIIAFMYSMGLVGYLYLSSFIVFYGGLIAIPVSIFWVIYDRQKCHLLLFPGVLILAVSVLVYWAYAPKLSLFFYDEFGFWGLVPREMILLDSLRDASSPLGYDNYPPATALLQYFMGRGLSDPAPGFYVAQLIMVLSPLSVFFTGITWKQFFYIPIYLFAFFYGVSNLGHGLASLYVDHIIAVYFGGIVAAYYIYELRGWNILTLGPPLFVLVLIKKPAIFFATLAVVIIVIDVLFKLVPEYVTSARDRPSGIRRFIPAWCNFRRIFPYVLFLAIPLAAHCSWSIHVRKSGLDNTFSYKPTLSEFRTSLSGDASEIQIECRENYWNHLYRKTVSNSPLSLEIFSLAIGMRSRGLSTIGWMGLISAVFFLGWLTSDNKPYRLSGLPILWSGALAYYFGLLMSYMFLFSEHESIKLAGIQRYSQIYLLGFWVVAVCHFHPFIKCRRKLMQPVRWGIFFCSLAAIAILEPVHWGVRQGYDIRTIERRSAAVGELIDYHGEFARALKNHLGREKRIFGLFQGTNGYSHRVMRYLVYPLQMNKWAWSVASPGEEPKQFTVNLSPLQLSKLLNQWDYLYIGKVNYELGDYYGRLFDGKEANLLGIYKIVRRDGSNLVSLKRAEFCPYALSKQFDPAIFDVFGQYNW